MLNHVYMHCFLCLVRAVCAALEWLFEMIIIPVFAPATWSWSACCIRGIFGFCWLHFGFTELVCFIYSFFFSDMATNEMGIMGMLPATLLMNVCLMNRKTKLLLTWQHDAFIWFHWFVWDLTWSIGWFYANISEYAVNRLMGFASDDQTLWKTWGYWWCVKYELLVNAFSSGLFIHFKIQRLRLMILFLDLLDCYSATVDLCF